MSTFTELGAVIIGRNEGERLITCIESALRVSTHVYYVDSGSTDGSAERAEEMGCTCVQLDMSVPFTAARARNAGWQALVAAHPETTLIHFVDGDCEIVESWVSQALTFLKAHPRHAVVCGQRVERFPDKTIYNKLCDIEWNTPIGEAKACGGDAIFRVEALQEVKGYRDDFIAGEEPELCVRLRQSKWRIERIDAHMTLHDAAMTEFSQWWKRTKRCGFAYALGNDVHGAPPERHWYKETLRAVLWGGSIPLGILSMAFFIHGFFIVGFSVYGLQWYRLNRSATVDADVRKQWSFFTVLGKLPEFVGVCEFYYKKFTGKQMKLIEYK